MGNFKIIHGDVLAEMPKLEAESFDACLCDSPYELAFMGQLWDKTSISFNIETWKLLLNLIKPGGHLLAFGNTRKFHRMMCAIEDAGWELQETLVYMYATGFPKGVNISKKIDQSLGLEQPVVGSKLGLPGYSLGQKK